jgi:cell division protein FtsI/penicillin-binding protein 2
LQIGAVYCAFVNGGYYREPYILKEIVEADGKVSAYYKNETNNKVLTDSVCNNIRQMLESTVISGSGRLAAPMGCGAAGKTATAETGWLEDGREIVHTWFAGYFPAENPEYVVVVFKEDGSSSATECAPIFRDVADNIE